MSQSKAGAPRFSLFDEGLPDDVNELSLDGVEALMEHRAAIIGEQARDTRRLRQMTTAIVERCRLEHAVTGVEHVAGDVVTDAERAEVERLNALWQLRQVEIDRWRDYFEQLGQA